MQELISQLTSQLGIDDNQAKGGMGILVNMAKDKLDGGDFGKLSGLLGGDSAISELTNMAPNQSSGGGLLGGLASMASGLGGNLGKLGGLAAIASQFKSLNIDSDMAKQFGEIAFNFLKEKGGSDITDIIKKFTA